MPKNAQVYGLIDPRDKMIHYIGSAINAFERLDGHLSDARDTSKTRWIAELKSLGLRPGVIILAIVPIETRFIDEYKWIYLGKISGWPLTNTAAMKTQKYNDLSVSADNILVVEIDNGLTWRKTKSMGLSVWTDKHKWLMFSFYMVASAAVFMFGGFGLAAYAGPDGDAVTRLWAVRLVAISTILYAPIALRRLCEIATQAFRLLWSRQRYEQFVNSGQ